MQIVVADTSPINYLIRIGEIAILPRLFESVFLPSAVVNELLNARAPEEVQAWAAALPEWVQKKDAAGPDTFGSLVDELGAGERQAIQLAEEIGADLLIIDDRAGVAEAEKRGIRSAGTLGVLVIASAAGMLDLDDAFERLQETSFHCKREVMDQLLRQQATKTTHRPPEPL